MHARERRRTGMAASILGRVHIRCGVAAAVLLAAGSTQGLARVQPVEEGRTGAAAGEQPAGERPTGELASEESVARFQQLLQRRPFHGPAFTGMANHAIERGKLAELIAEYVARVEALPEDAASRIVLSRLHLRAGDAAAAAAVLETVEGLPPEMARMEAELLVFRAEIYGRLGDGEAAERMLKEAMPLAGSIAERLRMGEALADLHLRAGKREEAVAALRELAGQFSDNYLHQKQIADALAQRGLHEAAAEQCRGMLALVGEQVDRRCEVLRSLGMSLERLGDRDGAIAAYAEAIGLLASDHWLQRELHERVVTLYRATGRLEDLAAYCAAQIRRAPEQTAMRVLLADVQAAMGDAEAGKRTLAEAVGLFPKDLGLSQKRVEFLERLGDVEGVAAEYQRAIGQHPEDAELYIAYGQSLASNRQVEAARNQWRHVLATRVSDAGLALRLGGLFEAYELADDAAEAYERAVALSPAQPEGYTALSRLWLARGEAEKALAALERMGAANANDGALQAALAQAMRNLGQAELALEAITRACELTPGQMRYHEIRAELLVQNGRLEEALDVRRRAIDGMTNPVQRAEAIATLVSMHATADRLGALKEREGARVAAAPRDVVALLILARVSDAERDFQGVRRWLDAVLAADPGNEAGMVQLAKLLDATGDIDAAVETYGRLIQRHPARTRQFSEAIVDLKLRYGDRAGAIETLEAMAKGDPDGTATLGAVAEQMVKMGEPERAIPFFERALRASPDRHEVRLDYGKALADAGRLEEAMTAFRGVATQRTDTDRAVEALGRLHETATQLGVLEDLLEELHQQVRADPGNTLVARALAQLLIRELEYARAMELLELVLRHNPRDADMALGRAELLRRLARFDEAVEAYRQVLRLPQIDRDYVLGEMGKAFFESGQVDQARRLWRQIQHRLYAGSLLRNNGLLDEAAAVFEEGIRLKPDDFALHRNLIGALEAAGKTVEALDAARRLLDLEPGNTLNIERLAEAYIRAGDRDAAARIAARLFSAGVGAERPAAQGRGGSMSLSMAMQQAMYAQYASVYGYGYGGGGGRSNLERGIGFFMRSGLRAELETVLSEQVAAQPDNAVLKQAAANLFSGELNKPERAMALLRELETASFPVEHQTWLGQCSQRDYLRVMQYNLIASKPALRDAQLAQLGGRKPEDLDRDGLLSLAIIRNSQGNTEQAAELLARAVAADDGDVLARGILVDLLIAGEKFAEAEPHARRLVEQLAERRDAMRGETMERVRRDFVRALPLELQLRVTEELLADVADKWTLGESFSWWSDGNVQTTGYLRAKINLGTILAESERIEEARGIWRELAPRRGPDVDRWTMLGDTAQLHGQSDLAFEFYQQALRGATALAGDPLLRQIYASTASQMSWYGEEGAISAAFNSIVESFAERDSLVELYNFLRDTDQEQKARRIAEQYDLAPKLIELYERRTAEAAAAYRKLPDRTLESSVGYFAQVCKLAELHDRAGNWDRALEVYRAYLEDFPDELGLLTTLGEVAEAQLNTAEAIEWERRVLETKARLAKRTREWSVRELTITPSRPQALSAAYDDGWSWGARWGKNRWWYGGGQSGLERSSSWMRLAQLYLAEGNTIAAADAMQRAVADADGRGREGVTRQVVGLIQGRQLTGQMLPVLRTLAVYAPSDERVQLAFADALEANGRNDLAVEVCSRLLRRGVSDLGVLAQVRRKILSLDPEAAPPQVTLETLEAEAAADPENLRTRLRLARAYFYSLHVDRAAEELARLAERAPHLEDVHDLLVEAYTLTGEREKLIAALRVQIDRLTEDGKRRTARWRLVDELLSAGRDEEALALVKDLGDPRDPWSYMRIGALLHYFGRHEEAIACLEQAGRSQRRNPWDRDGSGFAVAQSLALRGEIDAAADKVLSSVDDQQRQQVQYGGMYGMFGGGEQNPFAPLETVFAVMPEFAAAVSARVEARRREMPEDPQTIRTLMALHRSLGRPDLAEALLEETAASGAADQNLVTQLIDLAVKRKDYDRAVALAQKFIEQQPRPKLPPGVPPQYAAMAVMASPRTFMVCKLGDVYWEMGQGERALETYRQIVDEKIDETRLAYAGICVLRGRTDEARELIERTLSSQRVKSPQVLQMRAFLAALDGDPAGALDALMNAAALGGQEEDPYGFGSGSAPLATIAAFARQTGQLEKFERFVRERIAKSPQQWENFSTLAATLREAGRQREALAVLDEAEAIPSLTVQALQLRISWREGVASDAELIPLYTRVIELTERGAQADRGGWRAQGAGESPAQPQRDTLGAMLWDAGERERAERVWTERMSPQQAQTHLKLGRIYLKRHEYELAERAFARAVELDPDNVGAHLALAEGAFHRGDRRACLRHMHEVFVRRPVGSQRSARSWRGEDDEGEIKKVHAWAVELARDPELSSYLSGGDGAETNERAPEHRLMLAMLSGDWPALEGELQARIGAGSYDPLVWSLWARAQQRKGNWEETARALEFARRARQTSIGDHRTQLELVLAGRQVKEAAAGTRQAQPAAAAAQPGYAAGYYGSYYGGYSGGYWDADAGGNSGLAAIYLRLGRFAEAERLYLVSSGGGVQASLPALASLMWEQRAQDRALELMRLSLLLAGDRYNTGHGNLPQYASMLAEAGKTREAAELLIRAYQWDSSAQRDGMTAMWYGNEQQFEQGREGSFARALHEILTRHGMLDQVLTDLSRQAAADPADARLAKLIMSLQKQGRMWGQLRDSLSAWRATRPDDLATKLEQFHAECQLAQWDGAMEVLEQIRRDAPDQAARWSVHEVFVRLARGDAEGGAAAVRPLLEDVTLLDDSGTRSAAAIALAATGQLEALASHLGELRDLGLLNDQAGQELLVRALAGVGRWDEAAGVAMENLWRQTDALVRTDPWVRSLARIVAESSAAGATLSAAARAEDAAMLSLLSDGASAGVQAFRTLVDGGEPSVDALRGLVLAAQMAGDAGLAAATNARLLESLAGRRHDLWYTPTTTPIDRAARRHIAQAGRGGTTQLMMSASGGNALAEALYQITAGAEAVTYDGLWRSHGRLQRTLLAAAGDAGALETLVRTQARRAGDASSHDPYAAYGGWGAFATTTMYGAVSSISPAYAYSPPATPDQDEQSLANDWRTVAWRALSRAGRFDALAAAAESAGGRVQPSDRLLLAGASAAEGRVEEAKRERRIVAEAALAELLATDTPSVGRAADPWRRWYSVSNTQEVQAIRAALQVQVVPGGHEPELRSPTQGAVDDIWEVALVDRAVERQLLAGGTGMAPGTGSTALLKQLISFHNARDEHGRVIELIEAAHGRDGLVRAAELGNYLQACVKAREFGRVRAVLDEAARAGAAVRNDVDVMRLMLLRHEGKSREADALEGELLARRVHEPRNPFRLDSALTSWTTPDTGESQPRWTAGRSSRSAWNRAGTEAFFNPWRGSGPGTMWWTGDLAGALGVRFDYATAPEDITLQRLRAAYQRHGMPADAARILALQLGEASSGEETHRILAWRAWELAKAGAAEEAAQTARELKAAMLEELRARPADPRLLWEIAGLCAGRAAGSDYAAALEFFTRARGIDPGLDPAGVQSVHCLYRLGRDREAWELWREGTLTGRADLYEEPTLFYATIAALRGGEKAEGERLARLALHRFPLNPLAAQVRELIHEHE